MRRLSPGRMYWRSVMLLFQRTLPILMSYFCAIVPMVSPSLHRVGLDRGARRARGGGGYRFLVWLDGDGGRKWGGGGRSSVRSS